MKRITLNISFTFLSILALYLSLSTVLHAQENQISIQPGKLSPLDLQNYESFKKAIMPLINEIGDKKVVSLGEGTHGTSEFYKVRHWISRILAEEKGFNHIAFENDYSDSYLLNQQLLKGSTDYRSLMKNHLISIWQNREVEELFRWMQVYNAGRSNKVHFEGVDNVFLGSDVVALKQVLAKNKNPELKRLLNKLHQHSAYQDSIWRSQNLNDFRPNDNEVNTNGLKGYQTAAQLEHLLAQLNMPAKTRETASRLLMNNKQAFNTFYQWVTYKRGSSRDSCMAQTAIRIAAKKDDKIIIWAHNAHIARKGIYGGAVGGTGGFIEKHFPAQYFALGTGTASGTFLATTDNFDTRENSMKPYTLESVIDNSWEKQLASINIPAFYFNTKHIQNNPGKLVHRHIGYTPFSGKDSYDGTDLPQLYDGFLFIRETKAADFVK